MTAAARAVLLFCAISAPAFVVALPAPFVAVYQVDFSGLGGELRSSFEAAGNDQYVFENRTRASGLARLARPRDVVDRSRFALQGSALVPLQFVSEDGTRRNKRGSEIDFDWNTDTAQSKYKKQTTDLDVPAGVLDRQLMQIALMRDLASGKTTFSYTVVDRHNVKTYDLSVIGTETIEVPAGQFNAIKVLKKRADSSRSTMLWCVAELDYLPVHMQQLKEDDVVATLSLVSINQPIHEAK